MATNRFPNQDTFRAIVRKEMKEGDIWDETVFVDLHSLFSQNYTYTPNEEEMHNLAFGLIMVMAIIN